MTTATPALPRCTMPGCPVRFRPGTGGDRACAMHRDDDTLTARMERFAELAAPPGGREGDGGASTEGGRRTDGHRAAGQAVNRHGVTIR